MSDLQIGLLGIGALVIAAVYAFNRYQERKYHRQADQNFNAPREDILFERREQAAEGGARVEPGMAYREPVLTNAEDATPFREPPVAPPPDRRPESRPEESLPDALADEQVTAEEVVVEPPHKASIKAQDVIDEEICYVSIIHAGDPIITDALALPIQIAAGLGKPVYWAGLDYRTGAWESIDSSRHGEYEKVAVGIQLADRGGHLTEAQLAQFTDVVQGAADEVLAVADCPDRQQAFAKAVQLDDFCAEVDVLIGINIVAPDGAPFLGTKIRALAEAAGMDMGTDGTFQFSTDEGVAVFSLGNHESRPFTPDAMRSLTTHGVTLLFDVPRAPRGVHSFEQMAGLARQMADALNGAIVDDNRKPLNDAALGKIKQQLAAIYSKMEARQIPPGSARALRLFS